MNKRNFLLFAGLCLVVVFMSSISASLNVSLSDQGTNVTDKSTGIRLSTGNLTIEIHDSLVGGNLVHNETFVGAITGGAWNVMIGENSSNPLQLEFGKIYYKDYAINYKDLNFTDYQGNAVGRKFFYSPLGDIGGEDINKSANLTISGLNVTGNITVSGNVTASWFRGLFDWIIDAIGPSSNYLSFNGSDLTFSETYLNDTIGREGNRLFNTTANIQNLLNDTGIYSTYNATYEAINTTANVQGLLNGTGIYSTPLTINTTANIQNLLNGTSMNFANVGIGAATPTHKLNVVGHTNLSGTLWAGNGTLYVNTTNVGIGTTSPTYALDVYDNSVSQIDIVGTGDTYSFSVLGLGSDEATDKRWQIGHRQVAGHINKLWIEYHDGSTWITPMVMTTDGRVGVGNATPTGLLHIDMASRTGVSGLAIDRDTSAGQYSYISVTDEAGYVVFNARENNHVGIGALAHATYGLFVSTAEAYCDQTTCWNDASSREMKEDIELISNKTTFSNQIKNLSLYTFRLNETYFEERNSSISDSRTQLGFMADEVPEQCQALDENNTVIGLNYGCITIFQTVLMQEQQAQIDYLENALCNHFPEDELCK